MNKELQTFFDELTSQPHLINKLVVSLFVKQNSLGPIENKLIQSYLISESNSDDFKTLEELKRLVEKYSYDLSLSNIIQIFEIAVPESDKIINGVVYTPDFIKKFIVENTIEEADINLENAIGADISCGCGGFLITLANFFKKATKKDYSEIFKENLFGLDITKYSIERAKILLSLLAISEGEDNEEFEFNLFVGNALEFDWHEVSKISQKGGFDLIVGNPPYVTKRNMDENTKNLLDNWDVTKTGNTDLYIPFFEIGLKYLSEQGSLGYITVNTFFRNLNARLLRQLFHINKNYLKIIDFGDEPLFGSRSTYSCICFLKHEKSENVYVNSAQSDDLKSQTELTYESIPYKKLDHKRGWLLINGKTSENLQKIQNTGSKLGNKYKIRTGFATLRNKIYKFRPSGSDNQYFYREFNGTNYPIEKSICKRAVNPNKIKTRDNLLSKSEQIIFPYKRVSKGIEIISENIFQNEYPKAYEFLKLNRKTLDEREKGNGNYEAWYAYGRNQSIADTGIRLLYPHICKEPHFIFCALEDILFYNGHALYSESERELRVLKTILESEVFKYYLKYSSRNYSGNYISLSKNYIKHFGVCELAEEEEDYLLSCKGEDEINSFLFNKYGLNINKKVRLSA